MPKVPTWAPAAARPETKEASREGPEMRGSRPTDTWSLKCGKEGRLHEGGVGQVQGIRAGQNREGRTAVWLARMGTTILTKACYRVPQLPHRPPMSRSTLVHMPHTSKRTLMGTEEPAGRLLSSQRTNAWPMKKAMPGVKLTGSFGTPVCRCIVCSADGDRV